MKTYNYNTYDYEFKQSLSLLSKFYEKTINDKDFEELNSETKNMLDDYRDKILPIERTLSKYDRSTFNNKIINKFKIFPTGEIHIFTENEEGIFYLESEGIEDRSADNIICDLQDKRGINVSKY